MTITNVVYGDNSLQSSIVAGRQIAWLTAVREQSLLDCALISRTDPREQMDKPKQKVSC